ncbi:MAG: DUF2510 domain-containing protein [Ilumatobacteraceae bacterium]
MRRVDAPRAGWYPDPESRTSLRWWDGLDWTDVRRAPPSGAETLAAQENAMFRAAPPDFAPGASRAAGALQGIDSAQMIEQARVASRSEMERATAVFNQRALAARQNLTPLITEYTNKAKRWARLVLKLAILAFVVWLAFQIIEQVSFWSWVADRIEDIGNESGMDASAVVRSGTTALLTGGR